MLTEYQVMVCIAYWKVHGVHINTIYWEHTSFCIVLILRLLFCAMYHSNAIKDFSLVGCDTMSLGKWFQTLAMKMLPTSSLVQSPTNTVLYPRQLESKVVLISRCVQGTTLLNWTDIRTPHYTCYFRRWM